MKFYQSTAPARCDVCSTAITDKFYDARTASGQWGNLCPSCQVNGPGLNQVGTGRGQEYTKQSDGRWAKTAG